MKNILTIAGFDPTGGAGITIDLNVFQNNGIHGLAIPTCAVVQGPFGVSKIYPTPYDTFSYMLNEIKDIEIDTIKIGVLYDEQFIEKILDFINGLGKHVPIVLDPVLKSKNKTELLKQKGILRLKESLIPFVTVITPNIYEAEILTGINIKDIKTMEGAALSLNAMGAKAVVVKGGHIQGKPVDLLFDGKGIVTYTRERINKEIHGTGCVFSSLLASYICTGYTIKEAFLETEHKLDDLLKQSYRITGGGYYYMSIGKTQFNSAQRWEVINTLKEAAEIIYRLNPFELVPQVQMNLGYAIKGAKDEEDVAAFPGRISVYKKKVYIKGEPCFGASSHVARLILGMMKKFPHIRSCANIRYSEKIIEKARQLNMNVVFFDRRLEPEDIKKIEGQSLNFLLNEIISRIDSSPDMIYDIGDIGKEPMIRLYGKDPIEVVKKMEMILT
ncbi:MAG TPA: bifunctional hydroxymethylpyrimidine kinase/phosphomethylpyrimidine kinase [Syntrophorhabdaceae bacterium]|nr:bifunctional hydroxymethylpyrimidine kinase/phosphomethylpyrimidine kinase [Syntrophorhabdaceae bacterium]